MGGLDLYTKKSCDQNERTFRGPFLFYRREENYD